MEINNYDKIVNAVTKNILQRLEKTPAFTNKGKACLILMPNMSIGIKTYYEYIIKNYSDYDLYFGIDERCDSLKNDASLPNINLIKYDLNNADFVNVLDKAEMIIVLGLQISELKDLTDLDDRRGVSSIIIARLLANKQVGIMLNTNNKFYERISDLVLKIKDMGIEVLNINENKAKQREKIDLITEDYIIKLNKAGVKNLLLDKKQLITPLAKDKLRELKINVDYFEEENK